ncbi:hypothetical protein Lal_00041415 [Lupinus albus]|nr:hypothetical protein Lal_00041415 [Lupinus albus]
MLRVCCLRGFDVISRTLSFYSLIGSASLGAKSAFVVEEAKEKVHRTLEGGHKKPCFVCGSLEHSVKQCTKMERAYSLKLAVEVLSTKFHSLSSLGNETSVHSSTQHKAQRHCRKRACEFK